MRTEASTPLVRSCAARGSIITIYATGGGERDPAVADGQIFSDVLPRTSLPTSVGLITGRNMTWIIPWFPRTVTFDWSAVVLGVANYVFDLAEVNPC